MKTKPFTSEQLKKMREAWDALRGLGTYIRATDAEPTTEQLKKIQESYDHAKFREILNKPGTQPALLFNYDRKLRSLGLDEEYSGVQIRQFENEAWSENHLKNPPPRKHKKLSPLGKWADQFGSTIHNAKNYVPATNPEKLKLFNDLVYELVTEHTLLDLRAVKLAKSNGVPLTETCRYVKKAFMEAIERDDANFFARVGDVLRKRQLEPNYWEKKSGGNDDLDIFLCVHWVKEFGGVKPLYNLSIKELSEICHEKLPGIRTLDAIEKRRQRLGLLRLKKVASA
jgi:hypothetical protein